MTSAKAARLLQIRRGILRDRLKELRQVVHKWRQTFEGLFPHVRDFATFPEVRAIIELPNESVVNAGSYDVLLPTIPGLVDKWRKNADDRLLDRLKSLISCAEGVDPRSLATTLLFTCNRCSAWRTYPEVLTHCCQYYTFYENEEAEVYNTTANSVMSAKPWDASSYSINTKIVNTVLSLCDKDPSRTTQADMDALDERFVCDSCDGSGIETVMTWRAVVCPSIPSPS